MPSTPKGLWPVASRPYLWYPFPSMALTNAYSFTDYLALPQHEKPWLIKPFIPIGGIACLHGAAKSRKSFLSIQLARDIANGHPWLGFPTTQGRVLYIQLDTPRSLWQMRFQSLVSQNFGLTPDGASRLFLADTEHVPYPFHILQPAVQQWLRQQVDTIKPDLVIFDVIRKMFKGSDNDSDIMDEVIEAVKHTCQPAASLIIAHSKKVSKEFDGGTLDEMRGSGAQGAAYDTIFRLLKGSKTKPPRLTIEGRATEDQEIILANRPDLLFDLGQSSAFDAALREALEGTFTSERKRAEHLAAVTGEDFAKCQSALRRKQGK